MYTTITFQPNLMKASLQKLPKSRLNSEDMFIHLLKKALVLIPLFLFGILETKKLQLIFHMETLDQINHI